MRRTPTIVVLGCLLLAGAAVAMLLGRGPSPSPDAGGSIEISRGPVSNRSGKTDRLPPINISIATDQLRQAFADESAAGAAPAATSLPPVIVPQPTARPKAAAASDARNAGHKNYSLLSDAQIDAIKGRLNLTPAQQALWPDIETALRAVARKMHSTRLAAGNAATLDMESAEVQQLKSAAMPLVFQLREDQKREVRALARIIGLEKVAAAI